MNFKHMPELDWSLGYPVAIVLMVLAAALPYYLFQVEEMAVSQIGRRGGDGSLVADLSSHVLSAVDVDFGAVHVGRRLGAQDIDDLGDLVGGAEAMQRNLCATIFSVPGDRIAVSISPGAMALTRMPSGPKSAAISRVSDASAAFEVA